MSVDLYIMPAAGTGTHADPRRAKYHSDIAASPGGYSAMDYGLEPVFLVAIKDVPSEVHALLAAANDVIVVPPLAQQVGAALNTVQNRLEALNIPSGWVNSNMTYRTVMRVVAVLFQIAQRAHGLGFGRLFPAGVTLDTRYNQLSVNARQNLQALAADLNFDSSSLSGTSTMRQILKALVDQWPETGLFLGEETL